MRYTGCKVCNLSTVLQSHNLDVNKQIMSSSHVFLIWLHTFMISQSLEIPYFLSIYAHVCLHFLFYWTWIHSPISVVLFHYKLFSLISLSCYFTNSIFPIWNQFNHVLLCPTLCSENHSSCIHYKSLVSTNKTQPPTLLRIFFFLVFSLVTFLSHVSQFLPNSNYSH